MWRGGVGTAYLLPALSSAGASLASPCFRFHIPLIEPDVRIWRIRLSEKTRWRKTRKNRTSRAQLTTSYFANPQSRKRKLVPTRSSSALGFYRDRDNSHPKFVELEFARFRH